jgi:divalent metal cation (Fe/Co/Zn/Cd) transporter
MPELPPPATLTDHPHSLLRMGLTLEYVTLGWNVVGAAVALYAAAHARSVALLGFALDSLVEIGASLVVVWELSGRSASRRRRGLRFIGAAFVLLALIILAQSARTLHLRARPGASVLGIVWLALTAAIMLALAAGKFRVGAQLDSAVLRTEGRVTLLDAALAVSVLIGLTLNATLGWWWADPLAGLVIVLYGFKEGVHAWRAATG